MKYLLDTNICIGHLRSAEGDRLLNKVDEVGRRNVSICSMVRAELRAGAERSRHRLKESAKVDQLLLLFSSYPFDDAAADEYGKLRSHLQAAGTPIGANDLIIASIALANDLVLVTANVSEFERVPNLQIENWLSKKS